MEFRVAALPAFSDICRTVLSMQASEGETAAVAKASDDRQARLAQALRDNLHRRKAQSRARGAAQPQPRGLSEAPAAEKAPVAGTERDHGQSED